MVRASSLCAAFAGFAVAANAAEGAGHQSAEAAEVRPGASLCGDLADGRLDDLAVPGLFTPKEVGQVACNMAANIFRNGSILASPSDGTAPCYQFPNGSAYRENNYYNMWQRDSGLTMRTLLRVAKSAPAVRRQLKSYARLLVEKILATGASPNHNCAPEGGAMGGYCATMGEPKYFINGSVYTGPWGRMQSDGPAINAMVMMELFGMPGVDRALLGAVKRKTVETLSWVGHMGLDSTIEPWEMLYGQHFWVQAVQRKAMALGAALVDESVLSGGESDKFATWERMLSKLMEVHWNPSDGAVTATVARPIPGPVVPKCASDSVGRGVVNPASEDQPCELDMITPLASLVASVGVDSVLGPREAEAFAPHGGRILATAQYLVEAMASTYDVNRADDHLGLPGTLVGRYPGDEYSGVIMSPGLVDPCVGRNCGNPWFLTSNGLAELIYQVARASALGKLGEDALGSKFLQTAIGLAKPAAERRQVRLPQGPGAGKELACQLIAGGDGVLKRVKHHMKPGMRMSEQIYRGGANYPEVKAGAQFGVRDLTWSYASLLDALKSRSEAAREASCGSILI